jgi:hypothetical protein
MTLYRLEDGSVRVAHLDEWHLDTLRKIPSLASVEDDEIGRQRLFPVPFERGDVSEECLRDWDELVRPDLERLFADSLQRVAADLELAVPETPDPPEKEEAPAPDGTAETPDAKGAAESPQTRRRRRKGPGISPPGKKPPVRWSFLIPAAHVEDWFRAMNQARLMLSEKYEAHRMDDGHIASMFISGNMEPLIQYELFTGLCSWWVNSLLNP